MMAFDKSVKPTAQEVITYGKRSSTAPDLRLIHYNDVYHLDPSSAEPVGGIARFMTIVKGYQSGEKYDGQPECLTLFSGDAFNPSLESSITKGSHMVPILNALRTDCAALGNHDLDFGVSQFQHLTGKCSFPWLVANVLDPALGENVPIGNAKRTHMITASSGLKIGIIGLGEREWLETINALPPNLIYRSATETARELVPQLRAEGAAMIIALTHMREPNDNKLAENVGDQIDLILGGHDHFYSHSFINGCHVLRSGTDFKQLSYIEARRRPSSLRPPSGDWDFTIYRRDAVSSIPEHLPTRELAQKLTAKLKQSLEKPVGWTAVPLDARFTTVRLRESNIGNFVCDIMRHHYSADCTIMAAGTIRGDQIYPPGPVRIKDITDCFPFEDPVVVLKVTGKDIREALENGVSLYPALEGRFPQVSNIRFTFDPSRPAGSRVTECDIAGDGYLPDKAYVLATRGYMGRGKDGYKSLLIEDEGGKAKEIVLEENGILISMMLRQYFMSLKVLDRWSHWGPSMDRHWGKVASGVCEHHPNIAPKPTPASSPVADKRGWAASTSRSSESGWDDWTPARIRARRCSVGVLKEAQTEVGEPSPSFFSSSSAASSSGSNTPSGPKTMSAIGEGVGLEEPVDIEKMDWELRLMRRYLRKWCKLAGVHAQAANGDEVDEGTTCDWTQAVAPKVEGRIKMAGGE